MIIANYFFDCIKHYNKMKILYEVKLEEIIVEDEIIESASCKI